MPTCRSCFVEKPSNQFSFDKSRGEYRNRCKACGAAAVRASNARHPESLARTRRKYRLKSQFGITEEQYEEMLAAQGGVCFICEQSQEGMRLAVDHDRACCPGQKSCGECLRGLLCFVCNTRLEWLLAHRGRAMLYLDTHDRKGQPQEVEDAGQGVPTGI